MLAPADVPISGRADGAGRVTVIVPFRNEEKGLRRLLPDLLDQDAGRHRYEVVLVNDHSSDASVSLVEELTGNQASFRLLHLGEGSGGKKQAVALAMEYADSPWILQVDADCRVGPGWISSHMAAMEASGADLLAGVVSTFREKASFREAFERLDILSLAGAAMGSFYYNRPLMCSGANLMYSRELYEESRSFDPPGISSGDDMFLLIGACRLGRKLAFNPDPSSLVLTGPMKNWKEILRQRMRWGAKSGRYGMPGIQLTAMLVALTSLTLVLLPLPAILRPADLLFLLPAAVLKILADFILIRRMVLQTGQTGSLRHYPAAALLHPLFTLVILLGMPFRGQRWT